MNRITENDIQRAQEIANEIAYNELRSETPHTDSIIYPTTAPDCVTGDPIEVVNANDVRHMELTHRSIVANLQRDRAELVEALRWTVALLEKPNGSHNRTYQVRYEHASALLAKLGEGA